MMKRLFVIIPLILSLSFVSCGSLSETSSPVSHEPADSNAVASYSAALGTTIMGHRVVVEVPVDETGIKTYLLFEKENDVCSLYRFHFYPDYSLYSKDKATYTDGSLIEFDDVAFMLKVKGESPYETLEGAYAAYYNVDGFNII